MQTATLIFTRRPWNVLSWAIRWALPVSRFQWAQASHVMVLDGHYVIHATMKKGVVREPLARALKGQKLVAMRQYDVDDLKAGLQWAREQVGKPYDFSGAFAVSLDPLRSWQEDDAWFCYEFGAAFLHACGRQLFERTGRVTDTMLLQVCQTRG